MDILIVDVIWDRKLKIIQKGKFFEVECFSELLLLHINKSNRRTISSLYLMDNVHSNGHFGLYEFLASESLLVPAHRINRFRL